MARLSIVDLGVCLQGHTIKDKYDTTLITRKGGTIYYRCKRCHNAAQSSSVRKHRVVADKIPLLLRRGNCRHGHLIRSEGDVVRDRNSWRCRECVQSGDRHHKELRRRLSGGTSGTEYIHVHRIQLVCGQELIFTIGGAPRVGDLHWCQRHQDYEAVESGKRWIENEATALKGR